MIDLVSILGKKNGGVQSLPPIFSTLFGNSRIFIFFLSLMILSGCNRSDEDAVERRAIKDNDIIVSVNGQKIFGNDYKRSLNVNLAIFRHRHKNSPFFESSYEQYRIKTKRTLLPEMINSLLVEQETQRRHVSLTDFECRQCERKFLKSLRGFKSVSEAVKGLEISLCALESKIYLGQKFEKLLYLENPAITNVTEADVEIGITNVVAYNRRVCASNDVQNAKFKLMMSEISRGEPFEKVGARYSQVDVTDAEVWDEFERDEIESPELRKWAFSATVGDVGGPFMLADGRSLVKVLEHVSGAERSSSVAIEVERVKLARITLMDYLQEELGSREEIRAQILSFRRSEGKRKLLRRLKDAASIVFPSGTNLYYQVEDSKEKEQSNE